MRVSIDFTLDVLSALRHVYTQLRICVKKFTNFWKIKFCKDAKNVFRGKIIYVEEIVLHKIQNQT